MTKTNNTTYESMPARIKQFRKHLGLSQTEFGKELGLDQTAISSLEVGRTDITLKTIYTLIDLDCNPTWLLLGTLPMLLSAFSQNEATLEVKQFSDYKEYVVRVNHPQK